jgi:hypothetical protein
MPSKPILTGDEGSPVLGTEINTVNADFSGPDAFGVLNDAPPMAGYGPRPMQAVNGVDTPKLGIGGVGSPKTKG